MSLRPPSVVRRTRFEVNQSTSQPPPLLALTEARSEVAHGARSSCLIDSGFTSADRLFGRYNKEGVPDIVPPSTLAKNHFDFFIFWEIFL